VKLSKSMNYVKTSGECKVTWEGLRVKQRLIINYALINDE